jgi:hypothetical protein
MDLETSGKGAAMAKLAAVLTTAAANAHCTQHVWLAGEGFRRLRHDRHPAGTWDDLDLDCARSLDESWALLPPRLRNLGVRVLVSDLFWMANPVQTIRRLAEGAASLFVVQLLAQADAKPPVHGNLRLVDSETGQLTEIYIDSMVEKRYRDSLARLQQSWHDACRQSGAKFLTLIAEEIEDNLSTLQQAELLTAT